MDTKIQLKASTRANYEYLWSNYVKDEPFANIPLPNIRKSDILTFYTKLLKKVFAINSLESINIQQVMGHADFSTTMDIYTHITQENMREKAEAIKGNLVLL